MVVSCPSPASGGSARAGASPRCPGPPPSVSQRRRDRPSQDTRRSRGRVRLAAVVHRRVLCRVSCSGRARPACRAGEEAMSYQRSPDYQADAAGTTNPPGWYLDPVGRQSLRWWDGAQWARDTQPPLGPAWERPSPYRDAVASGYGASGQPGAGRHRQQDGRHGGMGGAPGPAPESFPPVRMQAQPDPGQPQGPQGPPSAAHHAARRRRNRTARGALSGLGALIGSSSLSARRTRTARHRPEG